MSGSRSRKGKIDKLGPANEFATRKARNSPSRVWLSVLSYRVRSSHTEYDGSVPNWAGGKSAEADFAPLVAANSFARPNSCKQKKSCNNAASNTFSTTPFF